MSARLLAFDFIAGCIGARTDPETDRALRSTIGSPKLPWDVVLDTAIQQKIAPAFWVALRKRELAGLLPPAAREALFKLHLLNTFKNKSLKDQAIEVIGSLNALGVEPVLLKGGASLFAPTFDDPGARVMADLDLLVPAEAARACWEALRAARYQPLEDHPAFAIDYDLHHHLRPLYRPNAHGAIEIHREGLPESAARALPTSLLWEQAETVANPFGIKLKIPSPSHRILHNVLHSDWINGTHARGLVALRSLHELVAVQAAHGAAIDWSMIERIMDRAGHGQRLRASLYLAHRCLGQPMPAGLRRTVGAWLHYGRVRSQLRWERLNRLAERLDWFSARNICERYQCGSDAWSVGRGRLRLAAQLARQQARRLAVLGI